MKITKNTDYGLIFLRELALNFPDQKPLATSEVAENYHIPEAYLRKIAYQLKNKKIIKAKEGRKGGYVLTRSPEKITLDQIIEILGDWTNFVPCASCAQLNQGCDFSNFWQEIGSDFKSYFKSIKLSDLI